MISDEEKKAIEWLKKADWFSARLYAPTILNLIEKQSKEIEEYKKQLDLDYVDKHFVPIERYNQLEKEIEELKKPKYLLNAKTGEITTINNSEFISNDKIKAKIEELEKQQKEEPDAYLCIKVLQSLLEKE